jgi:hypothetical protein
VYCTLTQMQSDVVEPSGRGEGGRSWSDTEETKDLSVCESEEY